MEAKSGAIYKVIRTNLPSTIDFDFSKDGKKILLTTEKGSCSLRKLPEDSSIIVIRPDGKIEKTPDFYFALSNADNFIFPNLSLYLEKFAEKEEMTSQSSLAESPQENLIATTHDGALRIWSKQTGDFVSTVAQKLSSPFVSCSFSKSGRILRGKLKTGHQLFYTTDKSNLHALSRELISNLSKEF